MRQSSRLHISLWTIFYLALLAVDTTPAIAVHRPTDLQERVVRVGAYENPPKFFYDPQGGLRGLFPDLLQYVAEREHWRIEWVPGTWLEGLANLQAGRIDIMPDVAYSLEKAGRYAFTNEVVFLNWATLYTRPGIEAENIPALEGKRVATMRGSIHTNGEQGIYRQVERFKVNCTICEYTNYQNVFQALQENLADIGVVNRLFGRLFQKKYDVVPTTMAFDPVHIKFAFPLHGADTPYFKKVLDRYLKQAHLNRSDPVRRIIDSYVNDQSPPPVTQAGQPVFLNTVEQAWVKRHPVIRLGIDPEFAPFEYFDSHGRYSGFASDYIALLSKRLGLHIEVVPDLSWQQVVDRAEKGDIDLLAAIGFSRKRSRFLSYTLPYLGFYRMVFCRSDEPFISGPEDLADKKIAVQANTSHSAWLEEHTRYVAHTYDTLKETILAVSRGEEDVLIGNLAVCTYWIRTLNITNLRVAAPVSLERQLLYMGVRKDWPILVSILNKGISSITPREAEQIRNRWLAAGYAVGVSKRKIFIRVALVAVTCLFAIGFLWFWNTRLQREVRGRQEAEDALLEVQKGLVETVNERTRELAANKKYLQAIFDAPREAIFLHDPQTGKIVDVNMTVETMFSLSRDEARELSITDISLGHSPYGPAEAHEKIRLVLTQGPQTFEWLSRRRTGELFWTEVSLSLITDGDRSFILAVVRDIDAKKKAEQQLITEQERLAVTLRSIGEGVISTDKNGAVVLLNRVAEELTGWQCDDAIGRPCAQVLYLVDGEGHSLGNKPLNHVFDTGQRMDCIDNTLLINRDGTQRPVAASCAPIRNRDGRVFGVVWVFRDVSSERRMEEELLKIRKLESIGVLAGGIAHDFNNILTALQGNIDLALRLDRMGEAVEPLLGDALTACGRAVQLTRQLLTFAKGGEPIRETASLGQLIRESAEFVLHGSRVSCHYSFCGDLWLVDVDRGQISQVIQNIIINARQAMPDGGEIAITCSNVRIEDGALVPGLAPGRYVCITIKDQGTGIASEIRDRIFDPFFSRREGGSGLGLAICHSIITRHHGGIFVDSSEGRGTVFNIYLPASKTDMLPEDENSMDEQKSVIQPGKILVMDDD
ncbi:MAG: transporter substrate-binding domain-containing protein, partial [Thermodesulfobacteria bacterium]|nr:transporter substrate-binding domain-containing protein [Thermodesulfobacteriota bacterium]